MSFILIIDFVNEKGIFVKRFTLFFSYHSMNDRNLEEYLKTYATRIQINIPGQTTFQHSF